ncbi:MAG: LacI family DNA-binding transcriptional regulator [Lachnospiraceae bacterium]|nr:LacI family DNA-binding transcriptional regulator [Lachnospiraceae bacterium]
MTAYNMGENMEQNVTMSDIAKALGISTVAVSKALSGKNGVSENLRKEVFETAEELGYERKEKKKKGKTSVTVGVVVADRFMAENRSYYWRIYQELTFAAKQKQYFTLLEVIDQKAEKAGEIPKLLQGSIDCLIVLGAFSGKYLDMLNRKAVVPLVGLDTIYEQINGDAVIADNTIGGYRMTEYLIQSGYHRIGYVGTLKATPSIDDRYMGYCKAMFFYGLSVQEAWLIKDRDIESGRMDTEECFRLPEKHDMPEAFFCNSDLSAMILIGKLRDKRLKVPEDVSVVGFDHFLPEPSEDLQLTTYEVDIRGMAFEVMELIRDRMEKRDRPYRVLTVRGKMVSGKTVKIRND